MCIMCSPSRNIDHNYTYVAIIMGGFFYKYLVLPFISVITFGHWLSLGYLYAATGRRWPPSAQ